MGSTLRAMVWGSFFSLALSVTGKTKGFWAAKVTSVGKLVTQYSVVSAIVTHVACPWPLPDSRTQCP